MENGYYYVKFVGRLKDEPKIMELNDGKWIFGFTEYSFDEIKPLKRIEDY